MDVYCSLQSTENKVKTKWGPTPGHLLGNVNLSELQDTRL